jgi:SAM-dependent methyltransferase
VYLKKGALREVYKDHYQEILKLSVEGKTLEVGSASGNLGDLFNDHIFSDIVTSPWVNVVADAQQLPFHDASFANIVGVDVLHHINWPIYFLEEASRLLKLGGKLILLEPAITLGSWLLCKYFHVEDMDMGADPLKRGIIDPSRDVRLANLAIPTLLQEKYNSRLKAALPEFEKFEFRHLTLPAFPLSGGFRPWRLIPHWAVAPILSLERLIMPFVGRFLSFRLVLSFTRR